MGHSLGERGGGKTVSESERVCWSWSAPLGGQGLVVPPESLPSLRGVELLGPSSSLKADGKWAHFWVCSGAFTETADPFVERLVVQPQSYRALPQGSDPSRNNRWL